MTCCVKSARRLASAYRCLLQGALHASRHRAFDRRVPVAWHVSYDSNGTNHKSARAQGRVTGRVSSTLVGYASLTQPTIYQDGPNCHTEGHRLALDAAGGTDSDRLPAAGRSAIQVAAPVVTVNSPLVKQMTDWYKSTGRLAAVEAAALPIMERLAAETLLPPGFAFKSVDIARQQQVGNPGLFIFPLSVLCSCSWC